ncbi:MAG: thioredoxin [Candidatus Heimdallarchaeaceae archaeon]
MIQDDETLEELRRKKMEELLNTSQETAKFPTGVAVNITDNDFDEFVKQEGIVVVDTWAAWCMPCRTMAPIMEQLAKEWADKGVHIGKLNVDENRRTAMRFGISSIPNFLVFQNGKYLGNVVGAVGKKPFVQLFKKLLDDNDETKAGYA